MTSRNKSKELVYFEDKGSVFDAPIDVVWDYNVSDNEYHTKAHHTTLRNMKWKNLSEITGEGTCEVKRSGRWSKMRFRQTEIPPFVRINEEFEGRYAGKIMVQLYIPKGKKTGIDVYVLTPKEVAGEYRETLANAFNEDGPMVRAFYRSKKHA
jgi:hypothetical protein